MIRRIVIAGFGAALAVALILVASQRPFADAHFAFGEYRDFEGTLVTEPVMALQTSTGVWPLAGAGKLGLRTDVLGQVTLRGARIWRNGRQMLEVESGSIRVGSTAPRAIATPSSLGPRTFIGEIVDAKCYLGVMNPGEGKVHKSCAARCLRGGLPAALATRDGEFLWLRSDANLAPHAGRPVTVSGELMTQHGLRFLRVDRVE